jgi:ABC-2 type transport system permease protein
MNLLQIYLKRVGMAFAMRMSYRTEYIISLITMFTVELFAPLVSIILYTAGDGFAGWSLAEVLLIQGFVILYRGLSLIFVFGILWNTMFGLEKGEFDIVFLKPRNTLVMQLIESFDTEDIAKILSAGILITYALSIIQPSWELIVLAFAFIPIAMLLFFSVALVLSAVAIRVVKSWRLYELWDVILLIGSYPKTIQAKGVQSFFVGILPIFVIGYFPTQIIRGVFETELFISIGVTILLFVISLYIYFKAIKQYTSAGG